MKKELCLFLFLVVFSAHSFQYHKNRVSGFVDFLYWQATEGSADNWAQIIPRENVYRPIQVQSVPFSYKPGFRIGASYDFMQSPLDITIYYTWYQGEGKNSVSNTPHGIYSSFMGNFFINNTNGALLSGPYYKSASIKWDILFNSLDMELGYQNTVTDFLTIRPFVGIKSGRIKQTIDTIWQTPFNAQTFQPITTFNEATEQVENNFWGIGPVVGMDSSWLLLKRARQTLNLFGTASVAILSGHWTFSDVYRNDTPQSNTVLNDSMISSAAATRGALGVEWQIKRQTHSMNLRLLYEGQVWFNQMRYLSFNMGRLNKQLAFQGASLECSIQFNNNMKN